MVLQPLTNGVYSWATGPQISAWWRCDNPKGTPSIQYWIHSTRSINEISNIKRFSLCHSITPICINIMHSNYNHSSFVLLTSSSLVKYFISFIYPTSDLWPIHKTSYGCFSGRESNSNTAWTFIAAGYRRPERGSAYEPWRANNCKLIMTTEGPFNNLSEASLNLQWPLSDLLVAPHWPLSDSSDLSNDFQIHRTRGSQAG